MKRSITITAWNRPDDLYKTLSTLMAVKPRFGYKLFVRVDGEYDPSVLDVCKRWNVNPEVSETRQGIDWNNFSVFNSALKWGTEFNVHLEDDILVSPDFFNLSSFYESQNHKKYLAYCFFSDENMQELHDKAFLKYRFCPWGWAFSRSQYERFGCMWRPQWGTMMDGLARSLPCLTPCLSRTTNIGYTGAGDTDKKAARKFLVKFQPSVYHGTTFSISKDYESLVDGTEYFI